MQWSMFQLMAVLLDRLGEPQTVTLEEMQAYGTPVPCLLTAHEDGKAITVSVEKPKEANEQ